MKRITIIIVVVILLIGLVLVLNLGNIKSCIKVLKMDNSTAVTVESVHEYLKWKMGASSEIYDDKTIAIHKWKDCNILMQIVSPDTIYIFSAASYEFRSPGEGDIECPLQQVVDNVLEKFYEKGVDAWIPESENKVVELAMECKFIGMEDFRSKFDAYGERMFNAAMYVREEAMRLARKNLKDENNEIIMLQVSYWGRVNKE